MKRIIAMLLVLTCIAVLIPAGTQVDAAAVTKKPFYMLNWEPVLWLDGDYVLDAPYFSASYSTGASSPRISWNNVSDIKQLAANLKYDFEDRPEGTRHIYLDQPFRAITKLTEDYVYFYKATASVKAWVEEFLAEYKRIGGELDGIFVDVEYTKGSEWYLYIDEYYAGNRDVYWEIVNNPRYETLVRPKLEKWGFNFWPESKQTNERSEIWPVYSESGSQYAQDRAIWNLVVEELLADSLNESVYEPLLKYYPQALFCDYGRYDTYGWQKTHGGTMNHSTGNGSKVGNVSNRQCYPYEPWENWIGQYNTPVAFNDVKYTATPYNVAMWGVTQTKNMYEADSNHRISSWMTFFNFQPNHPGSSSNTPYYSETIFHIGLLDPQPFYGYIMKSEVESYGSDNPDPNVSDYDYALEIVRELMAELTRVAGYSDRKPIYIPANWNSNFMLSGMYANGRNIWRITPDIYTGTSVEAFKVKDNDPTFQIAGQTITFPQGKIIADSKISQVGTCGYWVETPANVTPIITGGADRYEKDPSFQETFEGFANGASFSGDAWSISGGGVKVQSHNGGKALALTGNATVKNTKAPKNITAGDSYAEQQVWQVTVTAPTGGELELLRASNKDLGVKISNGKVYYDNGGSYKELSGVSVSAGSTYIIKREVDLREAGLFTSNYTVCDASGKVLGSVKDVDMANVSRPVSEISITAKNITGTAYIDNYKLYPTGLTTDFEVYDATTGFQVDTNKTRNADTAYRVSWLNGTDKDLMAKVYNGSTLVGEFRMGAGQDGQNTGVVKANSKSVLLTIKTEDAPPLVIPPSGNGGGNNDGGNNDGSNNDGGNNDGGQTTDPTNPVEDTNPTAPSTPVDATDPTKPADKPDSTDPTKPSDDIDPVDEDGGLTGGAIALIAIASALVAGGAVAIVWFVIKPKWLTGFFAKKTETQSEDTNDSM